MIGIGESDGATKEKAIIENRKSKVKTTWLTQVRGRRGGLDSRVRGNDRITLNAEC